MNAEPSPKLDYEPIRARPWMTSRKWWLLCAVFGILFTMNQFVDVRPYSHMVRDYWIFNVVTGGTAAACAAVANRWRRGRKA